MMKKVFPAVRDSLREMVAFISNYARKLRFQGVPLARLELVAEESIVNIISYGYDEDGGEIEITCETLQNPSGIKLIVKDRGVAFNPLAEGKDIDTKAPIDKRSYGGYGIFLVKQAMDEVEYQRDADTNILTMVKYREE